MASLGGAKTISVAALLVVAAALFHSSTIASAQSLRINSPRGVGGEVDSGGGREDGQDVLIKLPTDLKAVLDLQKADRRRIHASILGLHPDGGDEQQVYTTMTHLWIMIQPTMQPTMDDTALRLRLIH